MPDPRQCPKCDWKFDPPEVAMEPGCSFGDFRAALEGNRAIIRAAVGEHLAEHGLTR